MVETVRAVASSRAPRAIRLPRIITGPNPSPGASRQISGERVIQRVYVSTSTTPAAPSTSIGRPRSQRKYNPIATTSPSVPKAASRTCRAAVGTSGKAPLPPENGVRRVIRSSPEAKSSYSLSRLTAAWASRAPIRTSRVLSRAGGSPWCQATATPRPAHSGASTRKLGREARTTATVSDIGSFLG